MSAVHTSELINDISAITHKMKMLFFEDIHAVMMLNKKHAEAINISVFSFFSFRLFQSTAMLVAL